MSREFDRYMLHVDVGTEEKLATLNDSEFRAHIVGVLAIAAKAPVRGYLFVGELQAEAIHIARRAGVSERVAASALRKLKDVGVLVFDDEVGAWRVHSWETYQPERRDPTAAKRAAEYRARRAADRDAQREPSRDGHVTPAPESRSPSREARVPAPGLPEGVLEEEGEETPPQPPASGGSGRPRSLLKKKAERARNGSGRRTDKLALAELQTAEAAARLQAPLPEDGKTWARLATVLRGSMPASQWAQWFETIAVVARDGDTLLVRGAASGFEHHGRAIRQVGEHMGVSVRLATEDEAAAAAGMAEVGGAA